MSWGTEALMGKLITSYISYQTSSQ